MALEFGLHTFGDVTLAADGVLKPHAVVLRDLVEEGVLADRLGIDFFGVGEHHRADFAVSAPEVVLAAIAGRTQRIRLGSAVTVLSSDDPVRVFQRFSTLDAVSGGRAEAIVGRGSFTESFPLFGFDMRDYERLFEEKLDLFARLAREPRVTWSGTVRAPLVDQAVYPPVEGGRLRAWVGVGGSPESVIRAVRNGLPMMLAIIGGDPARFKPYVDLYQRASREMDTPALDVAVHSPGLVAETDAASREAYWHPYRTMHAQIGAERGWGQMSRADFDREVDHGSLYVGSPETVAFKIARTIKTLGLARFDLKYSAGPIPHEAMMTSIELFGSRVVPMVRELVRDN